MSNKSISEDRYQLGGSLPPNNSFYITRQDDVDILESILTREYCYIVAPRQLGKSSLRTQLMQQLKIDGIKPCIADLTAFFQANEDQFYAGLTRNIERQFDLKEKINFDWRVWWREQIEVSSPTKVLEIFIETILLKQVQNDLVIFLDEFDYLLYMNFSINNFFDFIRNCYYKRATQPDYQRLTFVLIGVSSFHELLKSSSDEFLRIFKTIELRGFQLHECTPLEKGLLENTDDPKVVLKEILYWTGGQPFLTQKLCFLASRFSYYITSERAGESVRGIVENEICQDWEAKDEPEHFRTIRDRLFHDPETMQLLNQYKRILQQGKIPSQNMSDHNALQWSGLVIEKEGNLVVANRIYEKIFNLDWVNENLYSRPHQANKWKWQKRLTYWLKKLRLYRK